MVSFVAGGADPGRGAERFSERLFGWEPATNQRFCIRGLRDVACRPNVKTGANVPSYSGGFAAWKVLAQTVNPFVKYWRARQIR